ncbi:hypothetical protein Scep_006367 [Stephania cephalantha]|uniref:Uncharacterized protein n=1 Tax=Stephania cephalantha TaxID=152367 RepID=A0AAP0PMX9_9MAGN
MSRHAPAIMSVSVAPHPFLSLFLPPLLLSSLLLLEFSDDTTTGSGGIYWIGCIGDSVEASSLFDCLIDNEEKLLKAKRLGNGGYEDKLDSVVDEVVVLGTIELKFDFVSKFFEMGSARDCAQGNRKMLFYLH